MKKILLIALLAITWACAKKEVPEPRYSIIPFPQKVEAREDVFTLRNRAKITVPVADMPLLDKAVERFAQRAKTAFGLNLKIKYGPKEYDRGIALQIDSTLPFEGYTLDVTERKAVIAASSAEGFAYGLETMCQLLPKDIYGSVKVKVPPIIPCVRIEDAPRFAYRGFHLDVARHFFSVDQVKRMIDAGAIRKLNRLHWHLTDDQGWRIEIKSWPRLTEVGSKRPYTHLGAWDQYAPARNDGTPHEGFYTQEQIKDVVAYAADRGITIVPEVEMPGHAMAALLAYPQLACKPETIDSLSTTWGVFEKVFCPKEETFAFFADVLKEVAALFPGEYIHVGGDECPKESWKKCSHCQALIRSLKLKDEHELQSYFIRRAEKMLKDLGKKTMGWDEILEGGLADNAAVMSWRGEAGGIEAARMHHPVVMTPTSYCYFDYYQADPISEPLSIGGFVDLKKVYSLNPVPDTLTAIEAQYIMGVQANLWSEYIKEDAHQEYMHYPRLSALAEVAWTQLENKSWEGFLLRMEKEYGRYRAEGIRASDSYFYVVLNGKGDSIPGKYFVTLTTLWPGASIYYTTDGSQPTLQSSRYEAPFVLESEATVKALAYKGDIAVARASEKLFTPNLATGCNYTIPGKKWALDWTSPAKTALTDGKRGYLPGNRGWVVLPKGATVTLDLGQERELHELSFNYFRVISHGILSIGTIDVQISSDSMRFPAAQRIEFPDPEYKGQKDMHAATTPLSGKGRFVRIKFLGQKARPDYYPYKKEPDVAIDEIVLR